MRKYILSKLEFPTKESELAQSITKFNSRIYNLFQDAYMFTKTQLEVEEAQIDADEAASKVESAQEEFEKRRLELKIKRLNLSLLTKKKVSRKLN
jgi:hypothetical protein